ncbi:hypothetical protein GCM10009117_17950 [Gangjinia marincola]|uniref:DUF4381 domain-containing protein n=1 Tax=Gangjinia marincola TaxID=578463 RepID=A0ABN1MI92_9FLAO
MGSTVQAQRVKASIDSISIKIGEQITYTFEVEADSTSFVTFPEGQTFVPLEMFESFKIDTTKNQDKLKLIKKYALTQFDSGRYIIPKQKIQIDDRSFMTDSFAVQVRDVVVDTTKQKMYPIKPSVEVEAQFELPSWIWWVLLVLLLLAVILFILFRRKKKKDEELAKLTPFERAMLTLKKLDESNLLNQHEYKNYYSTLTDAARRYLDEKVDDHAMERTTDELLQHLEELKAEGRLDLDGPTLKDFEGILRRADLAKFAKSNPPQEVAKADRSKVEDIIKNTKESLPEPTEEELLQDQKYLEELAKKRKRNQIIISIVAGVVVIAIALGVLIAQKGFTYLKDTYLGHPTKDLLEEPWIKSEYGNPPMTISTPRVLVRKDTDSILKNLNQPGVKNELFMYGSLISDFYVLLNTTSFEQKIDFDIKNAIDGIYKQFEAQGAANIIMKDEAFKTAQGVDGYKVYGSMTVTDQLTKRQKRVDYSILVFAVNNGIQQLTLVYGEEDEYAEKIAERIISSVEFNAAIN